MNWPDNGLPALRQLVPAPPRPGRPRPRQWRPPPLTDVRVVYFLLACVCVCVCAFVCVGGLCGAESAFCIRAREKLSLVLARLLGALLLANAVH
jgi:hypothetical protein